jgi:hypothetical protein
MQNLWPVKVCRQKLPKIARQHGREKVQYSLFFLRIRCGVGWLVWPHVSSFCSFFTGGTGNETLSRGNGFGSGNVVGVAAVDGCGGDDYGGNAEMSGGGG